MFVKLFVDKCIYKETDMFKTKEIQYVLMQIYIYIYMYNI